LVRLKIGSYKNGGDDSFQECHLTIHGKWLVGQIITIYVVLIILKTEILM